jgi:transketolase
MSDLQQRALAMRRKIILTANTKYDGHFGGCLSAVEILTVLFGGVMNVAPGETQSENRDRFILSKGHCALALYAALNEFGFVSDEELLSFHADGGEFQTHAVRNPAKGIEISSGSLAMGFSMACGIATALKAKGSPAKVFALTGNGEANEGLFWEAAMFAGAKELSNLCLVLDDNRMQNDGDSAKVLNVSNWDERLSSFGWEAVEVDGHDVAALESAFKTSHTDRPLAVVAKTVKGRGVPFMENSVTWHHNTMSVEQFSEAVAGLEGGVQ